MKVIVADMIDVYTDQRSEERGQLKRLAYLYLCFKNIVKQARKPAEIHTYSDCDGYEGRKDSKEVGKGSFIEMSPHLKKNIKPLLLDDLGHLPDVVD